MKNQTCLADKNIKPLAVELCLAEGLYLLSLVDQKASAGIWTLVSTECGKAM